ncbi:MAG: hypothetical protein FJ295_15970 [Planctomycetes bacterium]|nr:hypothetical protein [Planctomycetota bacterium]
MSRDVTLIMQSIRDRDEHAAAERLSLNYRESRRLASMRPAAEPPGQSLDATALVHEAYLRSAGREDPGWDNRGQFFAASAEAGAECEIQFQHALIPALTNFTLGWPIAPACCGTRFACNWPGRTRQRRAQANRFLPNLNINPPWERAASDRVDSWLCWLTVLAYERN